MRSTVRHRPAAPPGNPCPRHPLPGAHARPGRPAPPGRPGQGLFHSRPAHRPMCRCRYRGLSPCGAGLRSGPEHHDPLTPQDIECWLTLVSALLSVSVDISVLTLPGDVLSCREGTFATKRKGAMTTSRQPRRLRWLSLLLAAGVLSIGAFAGAAAKAPPAQAIVNGENAKAYSWAVALLERNDGRPRQDRMVCSGSLISQSWVLTAGHCVEGAPYHGVLAIGDTATIGRDKVGGPGGEVRRIAAIRKFVDSKVFCPTADRTGCDLALLKLDRPVTAQPVKIADRGELQGSPRMRARVYGYGWSSPGGPSRLDLWRATVEITSVDRRSHLMGAQGINGAACEGDSGGPLIISTPNGPRQIGVVNSRVNSPGGCRAGQVEAYTIVGNNGSVNDSEAWFWGASVITGDQPPSGPSCHLIPNPFLPEDFVDPCSSPGAESSPYCF
jgi:V8-like Glu-specific endopeptidase